MTLDIEDNSLNAILYDEPEKNDIEWNEKNVTQKADEFRSKTQELVLADAPGQITEELEILIEPADKAIILANDDKTEEISEWEDVLDRHDIEVLCRLTSIASLSDGEPGWENGSITSYNGTICCISRDDIGRNAIKPYDPTSRRIIRQVADEILRQVSE